MVHFSTECFARELIVTEPHTIDFCVCLVFRVQVVLRQGECGAEGRMFSLSYDTEHAVAKISSNYWRNDCNVSFFDLSFIK